MKTKLKLLLTLLLTTLMTSVAFAQRYEAVEDKELLAALKNSIISSQEYTSGHKEECTHLEDKDWVTKAEPGCCYPYLLDQLPLGEFIVLISNVIFLEQACKES